MSELQAWKTLAESRKEVVEKMQTELLRMGVIWDFNKNCAVPGRPSYDDLVETIDGADSILVCAGFANADLMDIIQTAQKRLQKILDSRTESTKEEK